MKRIFSWLNNFFLKNGKLRVYIIPAVLLIVLAGFGCKGMIDLVDNFRYKQNSLLQSEEELGINADFHMNAPKGITNIALFGIDARNENFHGLSDSIMIISIDAEHNDIKIVSVLRDSLVPIEGYGHQKINAAYNFGGPQLAVKTLNQVFSLNIRHYATVDFVSMADIIEVVGGIEAELSEAEVRNANVHIESMHRERGTALDYIQEAGKQTLNGIQAVAYARIRKVSNFNGTANDPGRTERQRLVMRQLFDKALAMDISKYPKMIRALLPYMETSLTYKDIFSLAGLLASDGVELKEDRIPADRAMIQYGMSVPGLGSCHYYNLDYADKMMNAFLFEDISFQDYMDTNGVDYTRWYYGAVNGATDDTEEPAEDDPAVDTPVTDLPVDEPIVDDPAVDDPAVDTPAVDDPIVDVPVVDTPVEDPSVEDPSVTDPPITDPPVAEQPTDPAPTDPAPTV